MDKLLLPTALVLVISVICLFFSKKNKDILSTLLFAVFGIVGMFWLAQMLYNDLIMPQEWWKEVTVLPGILIILIILAALDSAIKNI